MRPQTMSAALVALAAGAFLSACSGFGQSSVAQAIAEHTTPQRQTAGNTTASPYNCPAHGPLKYVSNYNSNIIDVFAGKFAGQAPCARITAQLHSPWGLYVDRTTHDLYVANDIAHDVVVFHRGATKPYNTYTDPTGEDPVDVVLTPDHTVVASNLLNEVGRIGSLSTWRQGDSGGTFVGNYQLAGGGKGQFVTAAPDGTIYFDKLNGSTEIGTLWSVSCPSGVCGTQTQVGARFFMAGPAGLTFSADGDLRLNEGSNGTADTFELPNMPPRRFHLIGNGDGIAINDFEHHWFEADGANNQAEEYEYPSGTLIGIVAGEPGGGVMGIAVDPDR